MVRFKICAYRVDQSIISLSKIDHVQTWSLELAFCNKLQEKITIAGYKHVFFQI